MILTYDDIKKGIITGEKLVMQMHNEQIANNKNDENEYSIDGKLMLKPSYGGTCEIHKTDIPRNGYDIQQKFTRNKKHIYVTHSSEERENDKFGETSNPQSYWQNLMQAAFALSYNNKTVSEESHTHKTKDTFKNSPLVQEYFKLVDYTYMKNSVLFQSNTFYLGNIFNSVVKTTDLCSNLHEIIQKKRKSRPLEQQSETLVEVHEQWRKTIERHTKNIYLIKCVQTLILDSINGIISANASLNRVSTIENALTQSSISIKDMDASSLQPLSMAIKKDEIYITDTNLATEPNGCSITDFLQGNSYAFAFYPMPSTELLQDLLKCAQKNSFANYTTPIKLSGNSQMLYQYKFGITHEDESLIASQVIDSSTKVSQYAREICSNLALHMLSTRSFVTKASTSQNVDQIETSNIFNNLSIGFVHILNKYTQYIDAINFLYYDGYGFSVEIQQEEQNSSIQCLEERELIKQMNRIYKKIITGMKVTAKEFNKAFNTDLSLTDFKSYLNEDDSMIKVQERKKAYQIYQNACIRVTAPIIIITTIIFSLLISIPLIQLLSNIFIISASNFWLTKITILNNLNAIGVCRLCIAKAKINFTKLYITLQGLTKNK